MSFKEFLKISEAGEMGKAAVGMSPSAINPAAAGNAKTPTMPPGKGGDPDASPLNQKQMKKVNGGPFTVDRYGPNQKRVPGISGSANNSLEKAPGGSFGSSGLFAPTKNKDPGVSGSIPATKPAKAAGQQLNMGAGTNNPNTKSPLPQAK